MDLLTILVLSSYAFTAGSYIFTWRCYNILSEAIKELRLEVGNHLASDIAELKLQIRHLSNECEEDCKLCKDSK